jgi:hypothetical protein
MAEARRIGNILAIGDTIRIEPGPALIRAVATPELLANDVTADHYQAPRDATPEEIASKDFDTPEGVFYAKDAMGQPIVLGQEMAYLDWLGDRNGNEGATVFYTYAHEPRTAAERKALEIPADATDPEMTHIWREIGQSPDEAAAITLAFDYLLKKGA